jgi:hypothetical protein
MLYLSHTFVRILFKIFVLFSYVALSSEENLRDVELAVVSRQLWTLYFLSFSSKTNFCFCSLHLLDVTLILPVLEHTVAGVFILFVGYREKCCGTESLRRTTKVWFGVNPVNPLPHSFYSFEFWIFVEL